MARSESPPAKRARRDERDRSSRGRDYDRNRDRDSGRDRDRDRHRDSRNGADRDEGRERERRDREDGGRMRSRDEFRGKDREREEPRSRNRESHDKNRDTEEPKSTRDESRGRDREREEPRSRRHDSHDKNRDTEEPKSTRDEASRLMDKDGVVSDKFRKNVSSSPPRSSEKASPEKEKDMSIVLMEEAQKALEAKEQAKEEAKEKASFEYSGKLAEETNKVNGVAILFTEPEEARKPTIRWRLYVFKDGKPLDDPLFIHRQSCYLFGRDRKVADIPIDHPSCSKQHAVLQYRLVMKDIDGMMSKKVRPYLMDLGSTNKTFLNGEEIEPQRYYELFEKDTFKFGNSSREYVLLHENSA